MNTWVQVDKLQDEEPVNAKTLNRPVDQLASRTDYLKKRLGSILEDGVQSALVFTDVDLIQDEGSEQEQLSVGNIVYRSGTGFRKAQAKMSLYDDYTASESAFTLGILINVTGNIGDVLIYGKLDLGSGSMITKSALLQSGEEFRSGRYYLSATEAGKLTAKPNGPLIYVGSFYDESNGSLSVGYVNPQFLDIGTSHVHRAYPLIARPSGTLVGGDVIGYLPISATNSPAAESSSSDSEPSRDYPSLIFDGTWTSVDDVNYVFTLDNSSAWGTVVLKWYKNGNATSYKEVNIPAPGVFVDVDNGLKVKVLFPEATNSNAWDPLNPLSDENRTWKLTFPHAGKGWLNHSVDAIASVDSVTSRIPTEPGSPAESSAESTASSDEGSITPILHTAFSGSWPYNQNDICVLFPSVVYEANITAGITKVNIGGTKYQFVEKGATPSTGYIAVTKAATIEETLYNLAGMVNVSPTTASVFVSGTHLFVHNKSLSGTGISVTTHTGVPTTGFGIVNGTIPAMLVYNRHYELIGTILKNKPTYVPMSLGGLKVSVFAKYATSANNYTCLPGTRLYAEAYDDDPEAIYDYVMGLHQEVDYYFPPVPAQAAGLFVNGVEVEGSALFPDNPTYSIGHKTLHWLEDAQGRLPWPAGIHHHDEKVDPSKDKTLAFYFVVGFQCATGPVTSLVPAPGSPIKLYTYGTNEKSYTGDLMIDADIDLSVVDSGVSGYNVAKQGKHGQLLAGPVVERIKAGNGIIVTQPSGCPAGQGTVTIGLADGSMRGQFNEIALENAKQEKIGLFPYVSLLGWGESNNIPSAFTTMMRVPSNLEITDYRLQLRMVMFGTVSYSDALHRAAGIQLEYNILPDYTDTTNLSLKNGLLIPDTPRKISVPLGHQVGTNWEYTAYDPFVATTDTKMITDPVTWDVCVPFSSMAIPDATEFSSKTPTLKPGYLVAIRVSRIATPDLQAYTSYTGPLGFLSMEWSLEEA